MTTQLALPLTPTKSRWCPVGQHRVSELVLRLGRYQCAKCARKS